MLQEIKRVGREGRKKKVNKNKGAIKGRLRKERSGRKKERMK